MNPPLDVFISYGRADSKTFVIRLHRALIELHLTVWLDLDDIPKGVNYQDQIAADLERSHNVIFVMSPHSVNSEHCRQELDLAVNLHKRVIPLLYLPEIDQVTWQCNYPSRPETDWPAYCAENQRYGDGRNPRLHPAVAKINWLSFEEGKKDFAIACHQLLRVLAHHRDYVEQHTTLLLQALEWDRHQRRSHYLLIEPTLEAARQWLLQPFTDLPPCRPTLLHGELIGESTRNAHNWMAQVCLVFTDADRVISQQLRGGLLRAGVTVWSSQLDIRSGQDYQQAGQAGIEAADNLVFLLSPAALQSNRCLQELTYALELHKRVIPILGEVVDHASLPSSLLLLQTIDLTDNLMAADYNQDENELLRVLHQDADYHRDHTALLMKALKWERQQHNPGILLRGYDLRAAEAWLKMALHRTHQPPLAVQRAFIEASLRQPPEASLDVFISYSRSDSDLARQLNNALQGQGKRTWFDQESIAAGTADFEQEIFRGIEMADNFLFVLSPQAVSSPYCDREVSYAATLNKRFITVLHRPVDPKFLPAVLAKVQWIDFCQAEASFYQGFNQMIRILETDRDHVQRHTQISLQALAWQQKGESADLLLRGGELEAAKTWCTQAQQGAKHPRPTELQRHFIQSSDAAYQKALRHERRQQRWLKELLLLVSLALVGASGLSVYALTQKERAETLLKSQITLLSDQAHTLVQSGLGLDVLLQATNAGQLLVQSGVKEPATNQTVADALQEALVWVRARNRIQAHRQEIRGMAISPDGQLIATASRDQTVNLWNDQGRLVRRLVHQAEVDQVKFTPDRQHLVTRSRDRLVTIWALQSNQKRQIPYDDDLWNLEISPQGEWVAIGSKNGQVQIWQLADGQLVRSLAHGRSVAGIRFSPDGRTLASWDENGDTIKLWNWQQGQLQQTLVHPQAWELLFSPDGKTLATRSKDGSVKLWTSTAAPLATLQLDSSVYEFAFSPDGQRLATATSQGAIQLWQMPQGQPIKMFEDWTSRFVRSAHEGAINSIYFVGPNGNALVTASDDYTVKVWNLHGQELHRFKHTSPVQEAMPSPDGRWVASYDNNQYLLQIWALDYRPAMPLKGHRQPVVSAAFSPDGRTLGTIGEDGQLNRWDREGNLVTVLPQTSTALNDLQISSDGQFYAMAADDGQVKIVHRDGAVLRSLSLNSSAKQVRVSPNRQYIATGEQKALVKLWSFEGELLATLQEQYSPIFSHDGQLLLTAQGGNVHLWSILNQPPYIKEKCILAGHPSLKVITRFRLSPDGRFVLTANADGTARMGTLHCEWKRTFPHANSSIHVRDVAVSQDGQLVVTVGNDNKVNLWSTDGILLKTLTEHRAKVFQVLFNPDGQSLATAANDQTIKIWNLQGELLRTLRHQDAIQGMGYSADGRQILAVHGQTPTLWNLDSEVLALPPGLRWAPPTGRWRRLSSGWFGRSSDGEPPSQVDSLLHQACNWLGPYLAERSQNDPNYNLCPPKQ